MSNELVKVVNGFNAGGVVQLDPASMLSSVRTTLEKEATPLMKADQSFLISGSPLEKSDEASTPLSEALGTQTVTPPVLTVGTGSVPIGGATTWTAMSSGQKATVLNTVAQVTKGVSLNKDGVYKTTHEALQPLTGPDWTSDTPRIQTSVTTNSYFSEYAYSLATSNTNGGSLSVDTPFGGGETSYEHAVNNEHGTSGVTTYSVGTYNVNKVVVELDKTKINMTSGFVTALSDAAALSDKPSQFIGVVQALNKYGWYVPTNITLGGVLVTNQSSQTKSWSSAQSTTNTFSANFKASFAGIGGGAAYNHADKTHTSSSGSKGTASLSFTAIGGSSADANDFSKWAASLEPASAWSIASYTTLIPSLYAMYNDESNRALLYHIKNLMEEQYSSSPELGQLQPLVDVGQYITALNDLLPEIG